MQFHNSSVTSNKPKLNLVKILYLRNLKLPKMYNKLNKTCLQKAVINLKVLKCFHNIQM